MSLNGNHDYEYATSAAGAANANAAKEFNDEVRADALIYATLALANEQRTANLIALLNIGYTSAQVAGVDYAEVADSIKERLGL